MLLLLGVTVWAAIRSVRMMKRVSREANAFNEIQTQYFEIAKVVPSQIGDMNRTLLDATLTSNKESLVTFKAQANAFKLWLDQTRQAATKAKIIDFTLGRYTTDLGQLITDLGKSFEMYLASAQKLTGADAQAADAPVRIQAYKETSTVSEKLVSLANGAQAQALAIQLFVYGSTDWFPRVQYLVYASLISLAGAGALLALMAYRKVVQPLRLMLAEKNIALERQDKLAHKGHLAAEVAHEIRNPLTAINIRLYTLQHALSEGTHEHEDATVIRKEIQRLHGILEDFLQLDRPRELNLASLNTTVVLREVAALMQPELDRRVITLQIDSPQDIAFQADPHQLKQVLINLIKNAAESIDHDGTIRLRARQDKTQLRGTETDIVIIEVEDTGTGIPAEVQERLFEPFFTTKKGGTGLGLSIAQRIMHKHRGALDFESRDVQGTIFRVVLPLVPKK